MKELIKKYNNKQFIVNIFDKEYNAVFRGENNKLYFDVIIKQDEELSKIWNRRVIKLINGKYNEHDIIFIEPYVSGMCYKTITFTINIFIDGFEIGKNIKNKKISKFLCSFSGINEFDLSKYYEQDIEQDMVKALCMNDEYLLDSGKLIFHRTNKIASSLMGIKIDKINEFEFDYNKKTDIYAAIKDIWHLKNVLCVFSKKNITANTITFYTNNNKSGIVFMNYINERIKKSENEIVEHMESNFIINYNNIKDCFGQIIEKSQECFENISPIISMYIDSIEKEMPKLNKFLALCQMLECFSREYDENNAHALMVQIEPNKANKDTKLKYRLNSLIKRVNYLFRFKTKKITNLSEKIAKGRNYYIHHDKSKKYNELNYDELFYYGFFLEDILLANIYMEIGVSKKVIKNSCFNNSFYYKNNIL